jgi:hypothetical protein
MSFCLYASFRAEFMVLIIVLIMVFAASWSCADGFLRLLNKERQPDYDFFNRHVSFRVTSSTNQLDIPKEFPRNGFVSETNKSVMSSVAQKEPRHPFFLSKRSSFVIPLVPSSQICKLFIIGLTAWTLLLHYCRSIRGKVSQHLSRLGVAGRSSAPSALDEMRREHTSAGSWRAS